MNGYAKLHPVGLNVRADMLESVAGYADVEREFVFAVSAADYDDARTLRWLACIIARRVAELEN